MAEVWERERAFEVPNPDLPAEGDTKSYVLEMLPYPSGELHMGHVLNYTPATSSRTCAAAAASRSLRPMGYDAFGLPAENAAIREGGHPREITERNIAAIREQMRRMGWAVDWSREVSTSDPRYYRWTQWLFLRFLERDLAYQKEAPVKWCPNDQTVLANEQVIDGRCERCGAEVEARNLEQWFFRITAYADELLDEMATLESWPGRVLTMQRNWVGRSGGRRARFPGRRDGDRPAGLHDAAGHAVRRDVLRSRHQSTRLPPSLRPAPRTRTRRASTSAMRRSSNRGRAR